MPERAAAGFEVEVRARPAGAEVSDTEPFRIGIFGDFSGRANRGIAGVSQSARPVTIDRDNFDRVLAKLAPSIEIAGISIAFSSLDDFHPDSLFRRFFRAEAITTAAPAPQAQPNIAPIAGRGSLLDRMLEESDAPVTTQAGDLQGFIDRAVAGSLVPGKDPKEEELLARANVAIAEQMRAVLHHPDFQALEAAWRALFFLTQRLETGVDLQIHLFDLSRQELYDDLNGANDLRATSFYRRVVTDATREPWSLLIGNFSFDASPEDIELLARIAMIAQRAKAPFLAAAQSAVIGSDSLEVMPDPREWHVEPATARYWRALRELPEASSIGLLMPRFLLRLPYGKDTNPTEEFPFEEIPGTPDRNEYLWGNPAIAAACLLGQAFSEDDWHMRPSSVREINRLPMHIYKHEGESVAQPCAEIWLSDGAAQFILERGIMPLVSARDSDRIVLVRFQSVADPPKGLAGRW